MAKKCSPPKFSTVISDFVQMMEEASKDYAWNYDEVNRMDRLTQDYLHKLELDNLDYKERAKVATQIAKCRQARRACKDTVEVLKPLVDFSKAIGAKIYTTWYAKRWVRPERSRSAWKLAYTYQEF